MYRSLRARDWLIVLIFVALPCAARAQMPLRAETYVSGFSSPIAFVQDPSDPRNQFVVQQGGRIRVVRDGALLPTDFLNLTSSVLFSGERGLLGLAFAPDYASSGRFYVNFVNPSGNTVIARFLRSADPLVANPSSRFDLRWGGAGGDAFIEQPAGFSNHKGGHLAFGPDGFLYIGLGDGGSSGDPGHRAQNPTLLLGKFLRIDVDVPNDHPIGYQIPGDNPFVSSGPAGTRDEIWSFGWRNPWRWSFDDPARGGTGALITGDVGQGAWEEIDYEPANSGGRNYGWRNREGAHDFNTSLPPAYLPLVDPIHEYGRTDGQSVTGGFVYRGTALGAMYRGRYFFADFVRGRVWSIGLDIDSSTGEAVKTNLIEHTAELGGSAMLGNVSSFGVDADGELFIVSYSRGAIVKVLGVPPDSGDFDEDGRADLAIFRPSTGTWYIRNSASGFTTSTIREFGLSTDLIAPGDYDGDGAADLAVFRANQGAFYIRESSTGSIVTLGLGMLGDIPVPGDYDGDGRTDPAVFRRSLVQWHVLLSSNGYDSVMWNGWGNLGDLPVPGDYYGDGSTDHAVFRPTTGIWLLPPTNEYPDGREFQWGLPGDQPAPGDYDGDRITDVAVYRPNTGHWFIRYSSTGFATSASFQWGLAGDVPVPNDYDGDGTFDLAVYRPANGTWYIAQSTTSYSTSVSYQWGLSGDTPALQSPLAYALAVRAALVTNARASDFDGDQRSDLTVFRPSNSTWFSRYSRGGFTTSFSVPWGEPGDVPVPHDYNEYQGDAQTDFTVWRPSTGVWWIRLRPSEGTYYAVRVLGTAGDLPVPGDYNGDSISNPAVFRPSTGTWSIMMVSDLQFPVVRDFQWGLPGDVPLTGDFDGDGSTDLTVYRPSNGTWFIRYSSTEFTTSASQQWGLDGDIPVPGDYDGDGKTDPAVYRPSTGEWYILHSQTNYTAFSQHQWGLSDDTPVPGDFDGDRKTDLAVWRPSNGTWYVLKSSTNFTTFNQLQWGLPGDIPILKR